LFSYFTGRDKGRTVGIFRVVTDSPIGLKQAAGIIEAAAVAGEKLVLRTRVFGYDRKRVQALKELGFQIGASLPGTVSLDGRRYDLHLMFKDLSDRYRFKVRRSYAAPGLYPTIDVPKAKDHKLRVRGYRREDRQSLDQFATHQMVLRGLASGVFEGLYPWPPGDYQQNVDSGRVFPLVCEDAAIGEPVGILDLFKSPADVMQHSMGLGMYVRPEYQGLGVGTMLMEGVKLLSKRLHLSRVWLGVFEGNTPAERLYRKVGFVECGKLPGWLQEGYVNETMMVLNLD
jgi:ribosomal protein S18 acetylase RimI-like enzyme